MFMVRSAMQVNKKTRTSAYQLLVDIAHELDDARPLSVTGAGPDSDDDMDYGAAGQGSELSGGLIDFVNAVMAGLVGASPHMQVRQQLSALHRFDSLSHVERKALWNVDSYSAHMLWQSHALARARPAVAVGSCGCWHLQSTAACSYPSCSTCSKAPPEFLRA